MIKKILNTIRLRTLGTVRTQNVDLIAKAQQGDVDAQFELSKFYFDNNELGEMLKWLKKAAAQNDSRAQNLLGYLYYNGRK